MTTDETVAEFQAYVEASKPYFAKVEADGDTAWFNDPAKLAELGIETTGLEARRELFMRRYRRPEPPAGIPFRTVAEIRCDDRATKPTTTEEIAA